MHRTPRTWLCLALALLIGMAHGLLARGAQEKEMEAPATLGLQFRKDGMAPGYTLISPFGHLNAYLLDADGGVVHQWRTRYSPGLFPYLLPSGNLLRGIQVKEPVVFSGGGQSGGVQEWSWDGTLLWEFHLATEHCLHHHDIEPLPNGNVLMIAWEYKSREDAIAAGRVPEQVGDKGFWPDMILEIEPLRPFGGRIVWEWHAFDHLIQDFDSGKPHFGDVAAHPERIDINADRPVTVSAEEQARLEALGYAVPDAGEDAKKDEKPEEPRADWMHVNAVAYHEELDQIAISVSTFSEIWILDHSTTTEEARGSRGGRSGRGGDLLYRWGNPQRYMRGDAGGQQLFHQHDVQWIPEGYPGDGHLTIFNNGRERPGGEYSSVVEIAPPLQADGSYAIADPAAFGPETPCWEYHAPDKKTFFASFVSGAHRLENGNTLICSGSNGRVFEVEPDGTIVWEYWNPYGAEPKPDDAQRPLGMFRARRISPDHPALAGKTLVPLDPQPKTFAELRAALPEPEPAFDPQAGWTLLIDEKLSHWVNVNCAEGKTFTTVPDEDQRDHWILHCSGKPTGILRSARRYENFIVELDWRHMNDPGNAGFFVWADPLPALGGPFTRSIEVQICNLGNGDWFTSHGDLFPIWGAEMTPDPRFRISGSRSMPHEADFRARPTGQWNHYRVVCLDGAITLEVNHKLVTAGSACLPSKGYLCLESEGGELHIRDLRLMELPAGTHAAVAERTASEAIPLRPLYNGLDLEGWEVVNGNWKAQDWIVTGDEAGELRCSLQDLTEGECRFDYRRQKLPEDGSLPFAIQGHPLAATKEAPAEWHRVIVRWTGSTITVQHGATETRLDLSPDPGSRLFTLRTAGVPTEYCNILATPMPQK